MSQRALRWRRLGVAAAMAAMAALVAGCGVEAGRSVAREGGDDLSGAEVLAQLRESVALIETPAGSGSAVLLSDGYLLTNAHVVDPFAAVDVTFEGADPVVDVPVVGVDLVADLAVVGPISTDREPATIADPVTLDPGSDVFLVGFPGDQRDEEVTLASGVISRTRDAEPWGLQYLQTDTIIGGGQSGGALVDTSGRVVGISGLEDYDGFAYSLSGADVIDRLDEMLDGGGRGWEPAPAGPLRTEFTVTSADLWPTGFYLPYVAEDKELSITVPDGTAIAFADPGSFLFPWAVNQAGADLPEDPYWSAEDAFVVEAEGGTVTEQVYAGTDAVVLVIPPADGGPITLETSEEMVEFAVSDGIDTMRVGETRDGVLNRLDESDLYEVELEAGESVEIAARSANGDMAWEARAATDSADDGVTADDGGGGLFDLDAVDTYTADTGGLHYVFVYDYDDTAIAYELAITEA